MIECPVRQRQESANESTETGKVPVPFSIRKPTLKNKGF